MSYIGNTPGVSSQRIVDSFIATSNQTTFTTTSGYTPGYVDVYLNGVKLVASDDFTASTGSTIVLATGASAGDSVEIVAYLPRGLSDGYLKSESDARYVALTGNQTVAGVKTFSSQLVGIAGTAGAPAITTTGDLDTGIFFPAANTLAFSTNGTEDARFDASGHFLVGGNTVANTPGWDKLVQISATNYPAISLKSSFRQWDLTTYGSSGALLFYDTTAGAERARIDSSGVFLIGPTSSGGSGGVILKGYSGTSMAYNNNAAALWSDQGNIVLTNEYASINFPATSSISNANPYWMAGTVGGSGAGYWINLRSGYNGSGGGDATAYKITNGGTATAAAITNHIWSVGSGSEAARIDSYGRLLMNNSSSPSAYPQKGVSVSGGVLHWHECYFGGASKVVTFSSDFNYFCELTVTVWGNASSGIYQGKFIAGRRDWTGANHMNNYADLIGTQLECSVSTSDSGNTRTFTVTFTQANDGANLHWSIEAKARNLYSFSVS